MRRLLFIAFFFEFGFALVVVPWSTFWDHNYFANAVPLVHAFITNNFVRGAVSGLGVVNIVVGLRELISMLFVRTSDVPTTPLSAAPLSKD